MNRKISKIIAVCTLFLVLGAGVWYGIVFGNRVEPDMAALPDNLIASNAEAATAGTNITLTEAGFTVNGEGASASGKTLTVTQGGTYQFSGSMKEGQIVINVDSKSSVTLVLNEVELSLAHILSCDLCGERRAYHIAAGGGHEKHAEKRHGNRSGLDRQRRE